MFEPMQACWFDTPVFYTLLSSEVVSFIWMCACVSSACVSSTVKVHACYQENSFTFVKTYLHVVVCIMIWRKWILWMNILMMNVLYQWRYHSIYCLMIYSMVSPHSSMTSLNGQIHRQAGCWSCCRSSTQLGVKRWWDTTGRDWRRDVDPCGGFLKWYEIGLPLNHLFE